MGVAVGEQEGGAGPPVAALLRRPAAVVRRRVIADLRAKGFADVLPAHLGVFQHPGPEGQRPGVLALRNSSSKQAMNHLLHQLEAGGYLVRTAHPEDRRVRVVRLTDRGRAALEVIQRTLRTLDTEWAAALGEPRYRELQRGLLALDAVLDEGVRRQAG